MFDVLYPWMHVVGRILFAIVFLASGVGYLTNMAGAVGRAQSKGAPAPNIVVPVAGVVVIVGGLMVALGWHRFIAAGLLFLFLVPKALVMHAPWKATDASARANEMSHFQKDLALAGAALLVAYYSGWTWPMSLGG